MATLPAFDDLFEAAVREALTRPTRLTPEIFEVEGSDVNIAVAAGAAQAEEVAAYAQGEINTCRLRTVASVSEDALEQYGASELGETRKGALSAIVPVVFRRQSGAATTIPAGTLVGTSGGVTFETIAALTFQPGQIGPLTVAAEATTAGPGGNVDANKITRILSTLEDLTFEVNNDERAAGGTEEQTPEDYQAQLQSAYQRARKGTLRAIQEAAETAEGVVSARAFEVLDGNGQTGRVVVQILGAGGATNTALAERVRTKLNDVRAAGVPVVVQPLNPRSVAIRAFGLLIKPGYLAATVLDSAVKSLVAFVQGLPGGETLFRAQILGVLSNTEGLQVPANSLTSPETDVTPGPGEYLTTSTALVLLSTGTGA